MFSIRYTVPSYIHGTIKVDKPVHRLGLLTDVDGNNWHVRSIYNDVICAVPLRDLHPYFTDTSGQDFDCVSQAWHPYKIAIVGGQA